MTTPLLTTKLYTPTIRPELLPRPRLIERLNAGLHRKLTLISAPAGFGKTALVTEWFHGADRPFTWLFLDEGDNDPVRFFTYLVATLQKIDGDLGQATQSLLRSSGSPQLPPIEALVTTLINDIVTTPTPFVLVLDDYHLIRTYLIHDALAFLLNHQPPQMHLVIVTRQDPPLPLPRLRVRGQVTEVRADDLRFTVKEAATFLNQALGMTLDVETVTALEARTEGWIAGLQLAALSMRGRTDVANFVQTFSGSHRHVIDYLAEEVLAQQPDEIRDFLRQTGILDRLTAPLCDAVTGRDDSDELLRRLEQANLFLVPFDDRREWYRYHHLLAEFLRTQLEPQCQAALHRKAAHWFEAHDFLPEAVKHTLGYATASGDMGEAARIVARAAPHVLQNGSLTTLLGWLDALPDDVVQTDSELGTYKGWILFLTGQVEAAEHYASLAENSLSTNADSLCRGRLLGLRSFLASNRGDDAKALQLAKKALKLLGRADLFFRSGVMSAFGDAQAALGDFKGAAQTYHEVIRIGQQTGNYLAASYAVVSLTTLFHLQGKLREAVALCQRTVDQYVDARGKPLPSAGMIYLQLVLMDYELNNLDQASRHLRITLELCQQLAMPELILAAKLLQAQLQYVRGEAEAALATLGEAREIASQAEQYEVYEIAAIEAYLHLKQGNLLAAERWAETAGFSLTGPPDPRHTMSYFVYIHLLLAQNRLKEAQTQLARLEKFTRLGGYYGLLIPIHVLQAITQQALGHKRRALDYLKKAIKYASPGGYARAFLDEGPVVAELLAKAHVHLDVPAEQEFVSRLLAAFDISEYESPRALLPHPRTQPLLEPLSERELEVLRVVARGLSNREVAENLFIATGTVRKHLEHIYGKLNVHSRTQAVARARELNLL
jgi:LuxR family maltose regulon positive regulatory protein